MNIEWRANLLQYLCKKNEQQGMTIIELFFFIVVFGIMAGLALPSFLASAKPNGFLDVKSMTYAQDAYYFGKGKGTFANSVEKLKSVKKLDFIWQPWTDKYEYSIRATPKAVLNYGISRNNQRLTYYVGGVFVVPNPGANEPKTLEIICSGNSSGATQPVEPALKYGVPVCGSGTVEMEPSKGENHVLVVNRSQQAFYGKLGKFADSLENLNLTTITHTHRYQVSVSTTAKAAFSYALPVGMGSSKLKSYVGGVFAVPDKSAGQRETVAIMCEANSPTEKKPAEPAYKNGVIVCGSGTTKLK